MKVIEETTSSATKLQISTISCQSSYLGLSWLTHCLVSQTSLHLPEQVDLVEIEFWPKTLIEILQ